MLHRSKLPWDRGRGFARLISGAGWCTEHPQGGRKQFQGFAHAPPRPDSWRSSRDSGLHGQYPRLLFNTKIMMLEAIADGARKRLHAAQVDTVILQWQEVHAGHFWRRLGHSVSPSL